MNNGNKQQVKRLPARRTRKYFQQNHKRKFTQTKERMPTNVEKAYKTPTSLVFSTHNHLPSTYIKITGINNHWLLISLNISDLISSIKRYQPNEWIQNRIHISATSKKHILTSG